MSLHINSGIKWESAHGIGGYFNEENYSIEDCRSLSRLEMIGFITLDAFTPCFEDSSNIIEGIIKGPWVIRCDPNNKTIMYKTVGIGEYYNCGYKIIFQPNGYSGMIIDYLYYENKEVSVIYSSNWSIDEILDVIGE